MDWHGIAGHDEIVENFRRALARNRLASTFLFVGPDGIGKRTFALKLAQCLLCTARAPERLDPCGECNSCRLAQSGVHPDLLRVARPKDRAFIPLELLIGERDKRGQTGLCHDVSLRPFVGLRRVAIIEDADYLKQPEGANCLLKTLEEPPPKSVLILIGTSAEKQLPTIRSRSQIVRFRPLPTDVVADLLVRHSMADGPNEARRLAGFSEGSLARAQELADPALWTFRHELLSELTNPHFDSVELAKKVASFVEAAGKEAPPRRARGRQVVSFAMEFYRRTARALGDAPADADDEMDRHVRAATGLPADAEWAADAAWRCHQTLEHIDRNANQSTWIEAWIDDLARSCSGR